MMSSDAQERVLEAWRDQRARQPGRKIPEWKGKTPDSKIPDVVRDRILQTWGGACYLSGILVAGKAWQLEHVIALADGGENREGNLRPALPDAHKVKSAAEQKRRAKADRARRASNGTKAAPKKTLEGPAFTPAEPQQKATKAGPKLEQQRALPPRQLFRSEA